MRFTVFLFILTIIFDELAKCPIIKVHKERKDTERWVSKFQC